MQCALARKHVGMLVSTTQTIEHYSLPKPERYFRDFPPMPKANVARLSQHAAI
jgi:hypothetical protein